MDILRATATEKKVKLAIISEPPKHIGGGRWYASTDHRAAILVIDRDAPAKLIGRGIGWVTALVGSTLYTSCYYSPNKTLRDFVSFTAELKRNHRGGDCNHGSRRIIAGDFNAWSTAWGSARENHRGRHLRETTKDMELEICNKGNVPTFQTGGRESVIDVTFATREISKAIRDSWRVAETETLSDHRYIMFAEPPEKTNQRHGSLDNPPPQLTGWSVRKLNREKFREVMRETAPAETAAEGDTPETMAAELGIRITRACEASAPPRKIWGNKKSVHWWNDKVAAAKQKCNTARRELQRARVQRLQPETQTTRETTYREAKKVLRLEIRRSKEKAWKELADSIERDPWGIPYKICMAKLKPRETLHATVVRQAVKDLFPSGQELSQPPGHTGAEGADRPTISETEVAKAIKASKNGKAPGPDNLPVEVIRLAFASDPGAFTALYNRCLQEGTFPRQWKRAKLVLLPKGRPEDQKFRPLCLLNTTAKIFEKIIVGRLEQHLDNRAEGGISENQYGFRKGKSTTDAIINLRDWIKDNSGPGKTFMAVSLDIKNAFNTACWPRIVKALTDKEAPNYIQVIIHSYLTDRTLTYTTTEGTETVPVTKGVPQGSVLGPLLWNLMFDGVLQTRLPTGAKTMCYADDTVILTTGKNMQQTRERANEAVERVTKWMEEAGLEVAHQKTVAMLIGRAKPQRGTEVVVGGHRVTWQDSMKYLGVLIDRRAKLDVHIKHAAKRAEDTTNALARLMPNTNGPRQARRRLLGRVAESIMLYAAPAWADNMAYARHRNTVDSAQRKETKQETCAYRTISAAAACVIAGSPPAHLLVQERKRIWDRRGQVRTGPRTHNTTRKVKAEEREETMRRWQQEWNTTETSEWRRQLIRDINKWCAKKGEKNYYVTQALSGHGCFNAYLKRFGLQRNARCYACGTHDDAKYVIFDCRAGMDARKELHDTEGRAITTTNLVEEMIRNKKTWRRIAGALERIMRDKEQLERTHQGVRHGQRRRRSGGDA